MTSASPQVQRRTRGLTLPVDIDRGGSRARRSNWGSGLCGVCVSVVVHIALFGMAAMIYVSQPPAMFVAMMDSAWSEAAPVPLDIEIATDTSRGSGDSRSNVHLIHAAPEEMIDFASINSNDELVAPSELIPGIAITFSNTSGGRPVRRTSAGTKKDAASGRGQTSGKGQSGGKRQGFFGRSSTGNRIAFVVDNSRSMGRPDGTLLQTRYNRVQTELVKSIVEMSPENEFYVVFFCDHAAAMPSRIMQPATDANKMKYLEWISTVEMGGGPTNPCGAMNIALRLNPDVIYFLTDGEFDQGFNQKLLAIKSDSIIHTFAFGEKTGEQVLMDVAENNGGEYKFIP